MIETGTATSGMIVVRSLPEEDEHDDADQHERFEQRLDDLMDRVLTKIVVSYMMP